MTGGPRLLVINPNTSETVSESIAELARDELGHAVAVTIATARFGAAYIASRAAVAVAGHAALDAYAADVSANGPPDAVVLACFGDPGFEALQEISGRPVVGFAEAGFRAAAARPGTFIVATNGAMWLAMLDELLVRLGLRDRVAALVGLDAAGHDDRRAAGLVAEAAERTGAAHAIIGGSGLIPRLPAITAGLALPVIDPHRLALRLAAARAMLPAEKHPPAPQPSPFGGLSPELGSILAG